jgi:hypothetical protein
VSEGDTDVIEDLIEEVIYWQTVRLFSAVMLLVIQQVHER